MKSLRFCVCFVILLSLTLNSSAMAQNRNWAPARQFRAIDKWQRENRNQQSEEVPESTKDPVASSSLKKSKTKTSTISSDNVSEPSGPLLLPPTPAQTEVQKPVPQQPDAPSTVQKPATVQEPATRKIVPAAIPDSPTLETEFSSVETPEIETLPAISPHSVLSKSPTPNSGLENLRKGIAAPSTVQSPSAVQSPVVRVGEEPMMNPTPTPQRTQSPQRSQGPVTILKPIPETQYPSVPNSPAQSHSTYRNPATMQPHPMVDSQFRLQPHTTLQPQPMMQQQQPLVPTPMQASPVPALTTVSELQGDHWIVSARRCDEMQLVNGCRDCLEFFYGNGQTPLQRATWDEFFNTLQPATPVSFFIHGSFINWQGAVVEAHQTALWIRSAVPNAPVRVVYFTWPSDVNIPYLLPIDVNILGQRSSNYGFHLAHLVGQLKREQPVTLVGHSHGGRLAASTMHLLAGGSIDGERLPAELVGDRKIRMVLASAAVDRNWLNPGQMYGRALMLPEAVLNLRNSTDYALNAYPLVTPFGMDSLGRTGPKPQDRMQMGNLNNKLVDMEAAPILGTTHTWPNYYNEPALARTIAPYVFYQPLVASKGKPATRTTVKAMPMPDERQASSQKTRTISGVATPKAIPVDVTPVRSVNPSR